MNVTVIFAPRIITLYVKTQMAPMNAIVTLVTTMLEMLINQIV